MTWTFSLTTSLIQLGLFLGGCVAVVVLLVHAGCGDVDKHQMCSSDNLYTFAAGYCLTCHRVVDVDRNMTTKLLLTLSRTSFTSDTL